MVFYEINAMACAVPCPMACHLLCSVVRHSEPYWSHIEALKLDLLVQLNNNLNHLSFASFLLVLCYFGFFTSGLLVYFPYLIVGNGLSIELF